jgi:hypothetical protein
MRSIWGEACANAHCGISPLHLIRAVSRSCELDNRPERDISCNCSRGACDYRSAVAVVFHGSRMACLIGASCKCNRIVNERNIEWGAGVMSDERFSSKTLFSVTSDAKHLSVPAPAAVHIGGAAVRWVRT